MVDCYCDYDPPSFYNLSTPKARKRHQCDECGRHIQPGEQYESATGKWEGCVSTFRTCSRCVDLRTWVKNNVPCLCWAHGNMLDDCKAAVVSAWERVPEETVGLRFGFLRRMTALRQRGPFP